MPARSRLQILPGFLRDARTISRVTLALVACAVVAACAHTYAVEDRETPIHIWLTAPALTCSGGTQNVLVYIGAEKVIEGPVRFPPGTPHIVIPTLYAPAGCKQVSVVIDGGRLSASSQIKVKEESWVQIVVREDQVRILQLDQQPGLSVGLEPPSGTQAAPRMPSSSGR